MSIIVTYESVLFVIVELFLVSSCNYRNQNLISSQEPRDKGWVVSGPYGFAQMIEVKLKYQGIFNDPLPALSLNTD